MSYNKRPTTKLLVDKDDYVYQGKMDKWDAAPVVLESHKLVFFTIPKAGCTTFKRLFRRMMGVEDWRNQDGKRLLPHNPKFNNLKYLYDYSEEKANEMMTSPDYTRVIFVRDPKLRFLSAFLDKALSNDGIFIKQNCCPNGDCVKAAQTLVGFLDLVQWCENEHWQSQSSRMESKYWPLIDFVGHLENAANDTKLLLQQINAWDEFGKSGWGKDGTGSIFESVKDAGGHATHAKWEIWKWYNNKLERQVEAFYKEDYDFPLFGFNITNLVDY